MKPIFEVKLNEVYVVGKSGRCYGWMDYLKYRQTSFTEEVVYEQVNIRTSDGRNIDLVTKAAWERYLDLMWKMANIKTVDLIAESQQCVLK